MRVIPHSFFVKTKSKCLKSTCFLVRRRVPSLADERSTGPFSQIKDLEPRGSSPLVWRKSKNKKSKCLKRHLLFGTLEGTQTPDLLVRSRTDKSLLNRFKPNLILFSPLITPDYSIISMFYRKNVVVEWSLE